MNESISQPTLDTIKAGDTVIVYPHAYDQRPRPCYLVKVDRASGSKRRTFRVGDFTYNADGYWVGGRYGPNQIKPVAPEGLAEVDDYRTFRQALQALQTLNLNVLTPDQRRTLVAVLAPFQPALETQP